jgi:hypothetical protein
VDSVPLYYVWDYTDVDRAFWEEHLEGWLPERIIDAHTHVADPGHRREPMTEAMRRQVWVNEASEPVDGPTAARCVATVFPGRQVRCVAMGWPGLEWDTDASNDYTREACLRYGWHALAVVPPAWSPERLAEELDKPGVIGVKPYYTLIGPGKDTRDEHLEADIFDFLPHRLLEVLDERGSWVTLHVPKAERLGHPSNIRQVREIRKRYPDVRLVIAHLGRSYTEPHAREGLLPLAEDAGLYFDVSGVLNPAVLELALEQIGPARLLYGTDNPVFYMRGRRQWSGRTYVNRTSRDFFFNKEREAPQVEAGYTLYMYEALKAIKDVSDRLGLTGDEVRALFHDNAARLIRSVRGAAGS